MYQPGLNVYRRMEVNTVEDPQKIVYMLFDRAITELNLVQRYLDRPLERNKHLAKAIALISELQAGVNLEAGEPAQFLFGLYGAIIKNLSGVNGPEGREIVERSIRYLAELKNIWKKQVLKEAA